MDRLTGFVLCKWIVDDAARGTEELSSDELDDDFAFFVGFATAEAFVAPQQLGPLVFVFRSSFGLSCAFALDAMKGITTSTIQH